MTIRVGHIKGALLAGAALCALATPISAALAQSITNPGGANLEQESFRRDLAITVARALQAQHQNALRHLARSWNDNPRVEPSGDLTGTSHISDPVIGGTISTYYHQDGGASLLVTYLNTPTIKGLGPTGLAEIRRELADSGNPMAAVHRNGRLIDQAGIEHVAPVAIPDNAPALVLAITPDEPQPRYVLEWQSSDLSCPPGRFGRVIERRRYLIERHPDGTATTVRQVAPAETRTDPKAYTDPAHPEFTPGYPASFPPLRVDVCLTPGTRTEYRNVNIRVAPAGPSGGTPPNVQCWDVERRTISVSGGDGGRPSVDITPWVLVSNTCGAVAPAVTGPSDPGACAIDPGRPECISTPSDSLCRDNPSDPRCSVDTSLCAPAQTLTRTEEQRLSTGCWGPEASIPGGWTGTINWLRYAEFHRQFLAACPREDRLVDVLDEEMRRYRDCTGLNGCRASEPGRGYFRESYSCTATQLATTSCPANTTGAGASWSRTLTATLTAGGSPSLSDPAWTWNATSCSRTETRPLACPGIPTTVWVECGGGDSGAQCAQIGETSAVSGEITQQRTITVSGSGQAPAPGGANASGFTENPGAWTTVSDTCVYPPPPPTNSSPGTCFTAGTMVCMADGRLLPIEEVRRGDVVRGARGPNTVKGLRPTKLGNRVLYAINGSRHFITGEHPVRAIDGWCAIEPDLLEHMEPAVWAELKPRTLALGDELVTLDGVVTVASIDGIPGPFDLPLYTLLLEGDHTFFADGFLVHNVH